MRFKITLLLLLLLPLLLFAVKKVVDLRKSAAGLPAAIIVDADNLQGPVPSSLWQNLAQGGEESTDMLRPVISQLQTLKPQLIRLDHLFDYYDVYRSPDNFDFSRLDGVIDSVLQTGAKPLLSLSYTPASMTKNGQNAGEPSDWNHWYQLVKATARRYSVDKNISGIYYEVWNEPDLFGSWHYSRSPSYSTLYLQTAKAIVDGAGSARYKIGGPAITAYYNNWIKALFRTASENHLPLDFISWHKYSKNIEDFQRDFDSLNSILDAYPQYFNIERLITEIGPSSEPDPWYDTSLSGIHLISLSTQLSGKIHRLFTFEAVDGPTSRSSSSTGWGILTHPKSGAKPKPRYQAIQFLNQLTGQRLASAGDGSWVTSLSTKDSQTIRVLLVNYDPRNTHIENVPITIQGLTPGQYRFNTYRYLGPTSTKTITATFNYRDNIYLDINSAVLLELTPM